VAVVCGSSKKGAVSTETHTRREEELGVGVPRWTVWVCELAVHEHVMKKNLRSAVAVMAGMLDTIIA